MSEPKSEAKSDKVKVVMAVESHNTPRGTEVEVDKKTADRLVANNQARRA